ncbi:MAG TPA: preprotein translocase subunit SecE [Candidatus Acidoferrales bacterium]|nr:preprotein translocase subunit SecE [Candidatus Acidoferrales bacterium]
MAITAKNRSEGSADEIPGVAFLRETYEELRKVVWPTPQELYRYTMVVIVTVIVISTFIGAADAGVSEVARRLIYTGVAK